MYICTYNIFHPAPQQHTAGAARLAAARAHHAERLRQAEVRHPCVDLTSYEQTAGTGTAAALPGTHTTLQPQSLPPHLCIVCW
jgi:hypothetical protein